MTFDFALVLDLDDTLVDYQASRAAAWQQIIDGLHLDRLDPPVTVEDFSRSEFAAKRRVARGELSERDAAVERLACVPPRLRAQAGDIFRAVANRPQLTAGTREFLEWATIRAIPACILTNGNARNKHEKIAASGLASWISAVQTSEESGFLKPDRRAFLRAAGLVHRRPQDCIMIGDELQADIIGALEAGYGTVIWLDTDGRSAHADAPQAPNLRVVRSMHEAKAVVEQIADLGSHLISSTVRVLSPYASYAEDMKDTQNTPASSHQRGAVTTVQTEGREDAQQIAMDDPIVFSVQVTAAVRSRLLASFSRLSVSVTAPLPGGLTTVDRYVRVDPTTVLSTTDGRTWQERRISVGGQIGKPVATDATPSTYRTTTARAADNHTLIVATIDAEIAGRRTPSVASASARPRSTPWSLGCH